MNIGPPCDDGLDLGAIANSEMWDSSRHFFLLSNGIERVSSSLD